MIRFAIFISFVFTCPVFGQSIQTESLAKQQQGDEPNEQREGKSDNRFPITVYGPQQQLNIDPADPPAALALDQLASWSGDGERRKRNNVGSLLQMYTRSGKILWTIPCYGTFSYSSYIRIVSDEKRQRIYLVEVNNGKYSIGAIDFSGNRLWAIDLQGSYGGESLMVDPKTGNLWVSREISSTLAGNLRGTIVFDTEGKMVRLISTRSKNVVYDHKTDSFFLCEDGGFSCLSRDFETIEKHKAGVGLSKTCSPLLDTDGTIWIYAVPLQRYPLLRQYATDGKLLYEVDLEWNGSVDPDAQTEPILGRYRIEPWSEEELLFLAVARTQRYFGIGFRLPTTNWIFNKKTGKFSRFGEKDSLVARSEFAIWVFGEKGVSATDFNSKELFSQKTFQLEDLKKERETSQQQADSLAKKIAETDPVVRRSQKVVADWSNLIKGYDDAKNKSWKISHAPNLHLIRSQKHE